MNFIEDAYHKAVIVLECCAKPKGFYASGLPGGYDAVWARDSMIISLGASLVGKKFKGCFAKSLKLLANKQSEKGQIPNAIGNYNIDRRSYVTFNSIDSSLWYVIGHYVYAQAYRDNSLFRNYQGSIENAIRWLQYQDPNEDGLLVQQPTMDWQDAFPHKYGHTINTEALYYGALRMLKRNKSAGRLRRIVNGETEKYLSLYDRERNYYLPWIWKNHDGDREEGYWFDTFGNLLAIVTSLATLKIAKDILQHINTRRINRPYPCKAIFPPLKRGDKEWHSYFSKADSRLPYHYLNAGIWPFIGGFYVAALVKTKQFQKAAQELEFLAMANKKVNKKSAKLRWGFHEWLHGISGKPTGNSNPYQGWSAGAYILAYESVKRKKVPFFI